MSRKPRFYQQVNFFHIMVQGINRSYIFEDSKDKEYYIKFFKEKADEYELDILTFCVMDNHVHFVIHTESIDELSAFMHKINSKYATYYNKKYDRVGYVFRDRYKSQEIISESQLYKGINYVYNNPVKAKMTLTPKDYKFLDYKEEFYMDYKKDDEYFIDVDDENESDKSIIYNYINSNNLKIYDKVEDLKKLIIYLRRRNMSFRRIEKVIGINRNKLSKLLI